MALILKVAAAVWHAGRKWPPIARRAYTGDKADKNRMADHRWGFADPALVSDSTGDRGHDLTDFLVEWVKLNAQRAAKLASCAVLILAAVVLVLLLALAAFVIAVLP